ncbi:MAG TPA: Rv2175c family DNA-binding protein [Mycobacteriales bacterium]|nr:Rv2175c family DNA-binding protein [Mycobacteriales bacterium]
MTQMLSLTDAARRMGIGVVGVKQLVKDHKLLAVRTDEGVQIPEDALDGEEPVKHLGGVLTLLHDAGYTPEQSYAWLTTADDSLPGTPLQALHENRATEVKRRAQALAF